MDADAKKRVSKNIDPKKGINKELTKYFGYEPSYKQRKAIHKEISTGEEFDGARVKLNNTTYIKTGNNEYSKTKEAQGDKVRYNPSNDTYVIQDERTGKWKKVRKDKL